MNFASFAPNLRREVEPLYWPGKRVSVRRLEYPISGQRKLAANPFPSGGEHGINKFRQRNKDARVIEKRGSADDGPTVASLPGDTLCSLDHLLRTKWLSPVVRSALNPFWRGVSAAGMGPKAGVNSQRSDSGRMARAAGRALPLVWGPLILSTLIPVAVTTMTA
jgi:hypothetical protein